MTTNPISKNVMEQLLEEKHSVRDALFLGHEASTAQVLTEIGALKGRVQAQRQRRRRALLAQRRVSAV